MKNNNWEDVQGYFTHKNKEDYEFLVNLIPDNGIMVEIGSFRGKSLACIAETIKRKNLKVYSVDIFDKVISEEYIEPDVYAKKNNMFNDFLETIKKFGLNDFVEVMVMKSENAAKVLVKDNIKLDLVFIDADHSYEAVKTDIESWWPLLKDESIMSGHDYCKEGVSWPGVHQAVHERFSTPSFLEHIWAVKKINNIEFSNQVF